MGKDIPKAPGQFYVKDLIPYDALGAKVIDRDGWTLRVGGLVDKPLSLTYGDLKARKQLEYTHDFDCVTKWSVKDIKWGGPSLSNIIMEARPKKEAGWVMLKCQDGYSAPVKLEDAMSPDSIIALEINDRPLTHAQGAPARPFIPKLYGWKSAKWLTEMELIAEYKDGYWEKYGYHERGQTAEQERFQSYEWKNVKKHILRMVKL